MRGNGLEVSHFMSIQGDSILKRQSPRSQDPFVYEIDVTRALKSSGYDVVGAYVDKITGECLFRVRGIVEVEDA